MANENLVLRPNCLLTRFPLVFLSGPRSLFSPFKMAHGLQDFIAAHGYVVVPLALPFRDSIQRQQALSRWLNEKKSQNFHFVMAAPTWFEFQNQLTSRLNVITLESTLTLICSDPDSFNLNELPSVKDKIHIFNPESEFETSPPFNYQLHQWFCRCLGCPAVTYSQTLLKADKLIYDRFLDHCIELAENDYQYA